jgi:subtilase family serine protease
VSPNVLAVGGTNLHLDARGNWAGETAWGGSGGGQSLFENAVTNSPDVAYDADPATGVAVYCTYGAGSRGPWVKVGGTSAGAPQWAALIAIVDQGRALAHRGSLTAVQAINNVYRLPSSDFHDIVRGSNGIYSASRGFDLVTGRGSPFADRIIRDVARL